MSASLLSGFAATDSTPSVEHPRARPGAGLTVREVARRYRVSPDRVRGWVRRGELAAINTADAQCRRPRFVIPPEALHQFERDRSAARPKPAPRRRRRPAVIDFYPD
jgi:hypothetical protein